MERGAEYDDRAGSCEKAWSAKQWWRAEGRLQCCQCADRRY
jgi:hypothetical protein